MLRSSERPWPRVGAGLNKADITWMLDHAAAACAQAGHAPQDPKCATDVILPLGSLPLLK